MALVGLFGLAMHLAYYWAAGAIVVLFVLLLVRARRSVRTQR